MNTGGAFPDRIPATIEARTATRSAAISRNARAPRRNRRPGCPHPRGPGAPHPGPPPSRIQGGTGWGSRSLIGEPVPDAVDREDVARVAHLGLDLAAQVLHV